MLVGVVGAEVGSASGAPSRSTVTSEGKYPKLLTCSLMHSCMSCKRIDRHSVNKSPLTLVHSHCAQLGSQIESDTHMVLGSVSFLCDIDTEHNATQFSLVFKWIRYTCKY